MTVAEWLSSRRPAPPPRLLARVREVLGPALADGAASAPATMLACAERLLAGLLRDESAGREQALDLLTVDALVTYALEAAAEEPEALSVLADGAAARLASAVDGP